MLVWPDINGSWSHVDRRPDRDARNEAYKLFADLAELNPLAIGATRDRDAAGDEQGTPYLRFGPEAYDRFVAWQQEFEPRLRAGDLHPALESHLAKYRKLVPAMALICHLAEGGRRPVGIAAVERALAWARYLETHARRAYGAVTSEAGTAKAILAKIKSGHLKSPFSSRDVWRPGWSKLVDPDAVRAGLRLLVDYDWLRARKVETAGRPGITTRSIPKPYRKSRCVAASATVFTVKSLWIPSSRVRGAFGSKDSALSADTKGRSDLAPAVARNCGTSVDQIERFYAARLPLSKEMARNLQIDPAKVQPTIMPEPGSALFQSFEGRQMIGELKQPNTTLNPRDFRPTIKVVQPKTKDDCVAILPVHGYGSAASGQRYLMQDWELLVLI